MKQLARLIFLLSATVFPFAATAQDAEMADTFRSEGKIYVVVAIILIVLVGLFIYLFSMDRKVSALEKKVGRKD